VKSEIERAQLVNKEIRQRVNVSQAEIKRYYEAHLTDYATADKIKVRGIFLRVPEPATRRPSRDAREGRGARDVVRKGKSFEDLAKDNSQGPGAAEGGELGTFAKGEMEPKLEEAAFALKKGEVSDPIQSGDAFVLLYVDERIGGSHRPLEEVSPEIREALYNEALQQRFQDWLSRDLRERPSRRGAELNPAIFREYDIRGVAGPRLRRRVRPLARARRSGRWSPRREEAGQRRPRLPPDVGQVRGGGRRRESARRASLCRHRHVPDAPHVLLAVPLGPRRRHPGHGQPQPGEHNGFKICLGKESMHGEQVQDLRKRIEARRIPAGEAAASRRGRSSRRIRSTSTTRRQARARDQGRRGRRGNATAGPVAPPIYKAMGAT
jgi:hypothetical protein